ncbi:hypothetical protein EDB89DRAFT_1911903 [Lactarius sanguifluus]|nr:hypothetical protein EDB89DRAFT_1911903 [Lactarius sanguifluus]
MGVPAALLLAPTEAEPECGGWQGWLRQGPLLYRGLTYIINGHSQAWILKVSQPYKGKYGLKLTNLSTNAVPDCGNGIDYDKDNLLAALEHPNHVCVLDLGVTTTHLGKLVATALQQSYLALTHLMLKSDQSLDVPVIPGGFLGGSASCLQELSNPPKKEKNSRYRTGLHEGVHEGGGRYRLCRIGRPPQGKSYGIQVHGNHGRVGVEGLGPRRWPSGLGTRIFRVAKAAQAWQGRKRKQWATQSPGNEDGWKQLCTLLRSAKLHRGGHQGLEHAVLK